MIPRSHDYRSARFGHPVRDDTNRLVPTWIVRAFGGATNMWAAGPRDSHKRDSHAVACIAEVISRFDVIALQEARRQWRWPPLCLWGGPNLCQLVRIGVGDADVLRGGVFGDAF